MVFRFTSMWCETLGDLTRYTTTVRPMDLATVYHGIWYLTTAQTAKNSLILNWPFPGFIYEIDKFAFGTKEEWYAYKIGMYNSIS